MSYCSIEEAWGSDFAKPKKKKKKNRKKPIEDPIDPEILIPDTREFKPADVRVPNISFEDTSGIGAYQPFLDRASTYAQRAADPTAYKDFMNPYQDEVIRSIEDQFAKSENQQNLHHHRLLLLFHQQMLQNQLLQLSVHFVQLQIHLLKF